MSGPDTEGSFGWNGKGLTRGAAAKKQTKKQTNTQAETKHVTDNNVTGMELNLLFYNFTPTSRAYTKCDNYTFN